MVEDYNSINHGRHFGSRGFHRFHPAAGSCIKVGRDLFQRYKGYQHADQRVAELILQTEKSWLKTEMQLELLTKITDELDPKLVECFNASVNQVEIKLSAARFEIERMIASQSQGLSLVDLTLRLPRRQKTRYTIFETHIQKTVSELTKWQAEFDPSWLFLIRSTSPSVDSALASDNRSPQNGAKLLDHVKSVRAVLRDIELNSASSASVFKKEGFLSKDRAVLLDSSIEMTTLAATSTPTVLVDTTTYPQETDVADVRRHVRNLARILMAGEPSTLGLLSCLGVLELEASQGRIKQYQLIYAVPRNTYQPTSLRQLLRNTSPSLDDKIALATAMAKGVASVHAAGFVHKHIRPETILTLRSQYSPTLTAYLVGFERFRSEYAATTLTGDMVWYRNLYRHPGRQGLHPNERYQMQHDIYSLGVCLLEVGLWRSLVIQGDPPQTDPLLVIANDLRLNNKRQAALNIKAKLIDIANNSLPALVGRTYTEVVLSCLSCLDPTETNMFANDKDLRDKDHILVGVAFIGQVLNRLLSIHVSD